MRFVTSMVVVTEVSNGGFGLLLIFPPTVCFPSQVEKGNCGAESARCGRVSSVSQRQDSN